MIKKFFYFLTYTSIFFVILYIYHLKKIEIPHIKSIKYIILSIIFLFSGFLIQAKVWQFFLKRELKCIKCNYKIAFISEYLSIFNKYIPGKIWSIIGPAAFISSFTNSSLKKTSYVSTIFQIMIIWTGFIYSFIEIYELLNFNFLLAIISLFLLINLIFFNKKLFQLLINKFLKIDINYFTIFEYRNYLFLIALQWLSWGIGFFFLIKSFYNNISFNFQILFIFPAAGTLGLIAFFTPGGLGIRESIIVILLMKLNLSFNAASGISIIARIWFLFAEIILFLIAFFNYKFYGKYFSNSS